MRKYSIYYKEGKKRNYVEYFDADSDETASVKVDEYLNNKEFTEKHGNKIFWDYSDTIAIEGGKTYRNAEEMFDDIMKEEETWWFGKKIYYWFTRKLNEYRPWFNMKLGFERMFKGYDRRVAWDIDYAVKNLLRYSIPLYVKNLHGCPMNYCEKARELLKGMTDEQVKESFKTDIHPSNRETTVGMSLLKADLDELIENINVIEYYDNVGVQDDDNKNWVSPSEYPIPHLKNSEVVDYKRLHELREKKMDEVFDYLRHNIDGLWD